MTKLFGAIDFGASSGRVIAGVFTDGKLKLEEVYRFLNGPIELNGKLVWDFEKLLAEVKTGLRKLNQFATESNLRVHSIGIDGWAVDYALLRDGELLTPPSCYREPTNYLGVSRVHDQVPHEVLYEINGLQFLPFNSLYQIARQQLTEPEVLAKAEYLVMLPDLVGYFLTGKLKTERTNASSTGLLDATTRQWNSELASKLGIELAKFPELADAGETLGTLIEDYGSMLTETPLVLVGSHDTASAVVGVPTTEQDFVFLSSGTWSLLGAELKRPILSEQSRQHNFTNELGVDGTVRYLRNLSGLWLLSESIRSFEESGHSVSIQELLLEAQTQQPKQRISVEDPEFVTPGDMPKKISRQLRETGQADFVSLAELTAIILHSLAQSYAENLGRLKLITGLDPSTIYVIGGGSQNGLLSQLTADYAGVVVKAGPVEATAIGNLLVQARTAGVVGQSLSEIRTVLIASDFETQEFFPRKGPRID